MNIELPLVDRRLDPPSRELVGLSRVMDFSGLSVLDLACGSGRNSIWLASLGANVHSVDNSLEELEILERVAAEHRLDLNVTHGQVENLDWDRLYDIVLLHGILHFLPFGAVSAVIASAIAHTNRGGFHLVSLASPSPVMRPTSSVEGAMGADASSVRALYGGWIDLGSECAARVCRHVDGRKHALRVTRLAYTNERSAVDQLGLRHVPVEVKDGPVECRVLLCDGRLVAEESVHHSSGIFELPLPRCT